MKATKCGDVLRAFSLAFGLVLAVGCGQKDEKKPAAGSGAGENPVTAPVDYLGAVSKAKQRAERTVDEASLKKAIEMFQAQEGRLPKSLNELVRPEYLPSLPQPPAGMKFDYNPSTGEIKVVPR